MSSIYEIKCRILRDDEVIGVLPLSDDETETIAQHVGEKVLNNIVNGFHAIVENIENVVDLDYKKGTLKAKDVEYIDIDLSSAYDEYYIYHNSKKGNHYDKSEYADDTTDHYLMLEVVTEEVAESNDLDFIDDYKERKEYKLYNEDYSSYVPLELGAFAQRPM